MVILADRNFLSHILARDVLTTGAHILRRASASFTLKPVKSWPMAPTWRNSSRPARLTLRVAQEMWALFAAYQVICRLTSAGADVMGIPPQRISFPHALPPRPTRSRLSP
jgi:hypothetical protein